MASTNPSRDLLPRLQRVPGSEPGCCLLDYRDRGREVVRSEAFSRALARARAAGDEHRLLALALLRRSRELCACEIQAALGVTHPTVSHHMAQLVEAGLVEAERRGKWMYYRLARGAHWEVP